MTELVIKITRNVKDLKVAKIIVFLLLLGLLTHPDIKKLFFESAINAYISVTSFVAATLFIFSFLEYKKFFLQDFIKKHKKYEIPIAGFLGVLPGCGGAIIVMSLYVKRSVSFSAVLTTLIATMGDAAFLLLARDPKAALIILPLTYIVGVISGYIAKPFNDKIAPPLKKIEFKENRNVNNTPITFYKVWAIAVIPALILGFLNAFQVNTNISFYGFKIIENFAFCGAMYSIFLWVLNPLSDMELAISKDTGIKKVCDTTCFVTTWVVIAFVIYEILNHVSGGDIWEHIKYFGPFVPLVAILVGFIPGCGPQIMITSMYVGGNLPFAAQLGNSISNDGDALFPALAISPKTAILATIYSAIPAIIVAYLWYYLV